MPYVDRVRGGFKVRWREGGRGSPKLASEVFARAEQADEFLEALTHQLAAAKALSRSAALGAPIVLPELVRRWKTARVAEQAITPEYGDEVIGHVCRLAKAMGWTSSSIITPAEVDRWRTGNGGRNARIGAYLRAVLRWASEKANQAVPHGTLVALRPPRARRRAKAPLPSSATIRAWQRASDACSASAGALVHCLATYGWRSATAARLLVGDVDLRRSTIRLRGLKGGGDDLAHPMLPTTAKRLRPLMKSRAADAPLFIDPRSGRGWDGAISHWWRVHIDPTTGVYQLKRHAISTMLARGIAAADVALFTGHRTLSQVLTYARTNEERAQRALKAMARRGHRTELRQSKAHARSA